MSTPSRPAADASRVREEALDWFVRRRNEAFSAEEEQAFQSWLAADAAHRAAFGRWEGEWQAFDEIPQDMRSLLQSDLACEQRMDAASSAGAESWTTTQTAPQAAASGQERPVQWPPQRPTQQPVPSRRRVLAPALALATVAAVTGGSGLLAWNHWQARPVFAQAFSTQRGQQTDVPLPDGTRLRLDTATRLEATYYRQRREVNLLDGQAVFAVQGDAQRPFHVLAGPVRVTVVGTRFSVRHTPDIPDGAGVQIAVDEGMVRVERIAPGTGRSPAVANDSAQVVILSAGRQVSSDAAGVLSAVSAVSAAGIAPWRDHRIRFDNLRLDRALAELARYGDPQLVIRDPAVAALPITGVFDPRDLTTFRRVLPASLPVRLKATSDGAAEVVLAR